MSLLISWLQAAPRRGSTMTRWLRHLGAFGLFFLAVLDSSPVPTFAGPDILTAILAASHRNPWYEYAIVATAGSVLGAWITYRLAQHAGYRYLQGKLGERRVKAVEAFFEKWGTGALAASTAVPIPFPTSVFFAAAGASNYPLRRYLVLVLVCRAIRYSAVALIADHYGRHFVRVLRHPEQYWGWMLVFVASACGMTLIAVLLRKRLAEA